MVQTIEKGRNVLRSRLRSETRADHEATEAAFARWDLSTRKGLESTLRAHVSALESLAASLEARSDDFTEVQRLTNLARAGLEALSASPRGNLREPSSLHPLGVSYVILGSRLGAGIQAGQLQPTSDQAVQTARQYFCDRGSGKHWRRLLAELETVHTPAEQNTIIQAARAAFSLFSDEAAAVEDGEDD